MKFTTLFFMIGFILSCFSGYSQSTSNPYKERCKYLDTSELTTNHLANYTWPLAYLPLLKGSIRDSIDVDIFEQLYYDLKVTEVGNTTLPDFETFEERVRSYSDLYTIPMGLIYQNFNHFKLNAVEDEWLLLENDHYVRSPDYTGPLYEEATTFAMAPLRGSSHFTPGKAVTFYFPNELIFNGTNQIINQYEIDFGNGSGFQNITPDSQSEVLYGAAGEKQLTLRAITSTDTLYSISYISLVEVHPTNTSAGLLAATGGDGICAPDWVEPFSTPAEFHCGVLQPTASANAYIRYANPDNPQLTKPLIFVEGLDIGKQAISIRVNSPGRPNLKVPIRFGNFGWDVLTTGIGPDPQDKSKLIPLPVFALLPDLIDGFTADGFDVILLDFEDGATFIQQNTKLLIQLIDWVNEQKDGCEQNVVLGASMGGAIARIALKTMEDNNKDHDTRLYVSFDAPHQGTNIPIGVQGLIKSIHDGFSFIAGAREPLESLQRPGSKQLLIHHIDEDDCLREEFVNELDQLGYPENCRNVAIVSGSNQGEGGIQAPLPGDKLLDLNLASVGIPAPFFPSHFELNIDIFSSERKDYVGTQDVLDANLFIQSIWGFPGFPISIFVNGNADHDIQPSLHGALSSAPGGYRNTIADSFAPVLEKVKKWFPLAAQVLPGINIPFTHLEFEGQHSFSPSISALDVNTDDLFFQLEGNITPVAPNPSLTPFDAYYSQPENLQHVEVSPGIEEWMDTELPKSRADLSNVLTETYNYGRIVTLLPDVTIAQTGILRINDIGPTGFLNGDNSNQEYFHVYTHAACDADIIVQDGGQFILGSEAAPYQHGIVHVEDGSTIYVEAGGTLSVKRRSDLILESGSHLELSGLLEARFGGQVIIKDGASLRVADGGTLRMIHSSNLIVEDGGQLIIEDGANIDLWDNTNHRAHVSVFGELVINGQLSIGGSGYFKFNKGNTVTFGPNISEFVFTGNDQDHRFFVIGEDATLAFGEMPIRLMNGIIEYEAGSTISIEGAPYVNLQTLRLNGLSGSGIAISTERVPTVDLLSCYFSNLQTGLSSQNDGTGTVLVRGCEFSESGTGINTNRIGGVDLQYCRFSKLQRGLNALNDGTGRVLLRGCNFELCRYGLFNGGQERVDVYSSNFSGEGMEVGMATLLFGIPNVSMTSTDIVDYNGPAYRNDYELGDHQEGSNHPAISLSHDEGITNLSMYGCLVRNNKIGVLLEEGSNDFSDGNIFVRDRTTFQDNETGILMWRGRHQAFNEAGLVLLDCARMIDNGVGVKGIDVLLQVDAEENCLECVGNPNIQIRPNTLIAPWLLSGPANIFDICYQEFEVIEIPAKGNYWDGVFPSDVPLDQMWRFTTSMSCSGFVDDNILDPTNNLPTEPTNCPDESPNDDCPPGEICVVNPPNDKIVIVEIEGNTYNVHSQYAAAYQDFRNENLTRSKERFMPIAGIPDEIKKNLNGVGNHYIDVARVMVNALQDHQNENQAGLNNEASYSNTYGHLWLTENKQSAPTKALEDLFFTVHPNPANDQVIVETVSGDYELSVYSVLGSLVYRTKINQRIILEVTDWEKGLYTIELKDENNFKNTIVQKLIIQ